MTPTASQDRFSRPNGPEPAQSYTSVISGPQNGCTGRGWHRTDKETDR